jgi:phosphoglycolate phosphatase-like HAD superfamily hydrolase
MTSPKTTKRRLVLFDIDGTLVINSQRSTNAWKQRLEKVFSDVYGTGAPLVLTVGTFNGRVDRQTFWQIAQAYNIDRKTFLSHIKEAFDVFHGELKRAVEEQTVRYVPIPDAVALVKKLKTHDTFALGLVTGNIEKNAWLKLKNAGIDHLFSFGAFSDAVDDRPGLVGLALKLSEKYFKQSFNSSETIVIGDTVHDIAAGQAHGTVTIGVASGITNSLAELEAQKPTLSVDSLSHKDVNALFFS